MTKNQKRNDYTSNDYFNVSVIVSVADLPLLSLLLRKPPPKPSPAPPKVPAEPTRGLPTHGLAAAKNPFLAAGATAR